MKVYNLQRYHDDDEAKELYEKKLFLLKKK